MASADYYVVWLSWREHLVRAAQESVRYARHHMPILGWAGVICLISYYFIWTIVYPNSFESFTVRFAGALISIPAILSKKLKKPLVEWLPLYWMFGLTYVLPFVFGYMLAQNAAHATFVGETNLVWPLQNVVALVVFILLVNDGVLATLLWLAATAVILVAVFSLNTNPNVDELIRVYLEPMPLYGFILVVGSLAIRNRKIIELEKLRAMSRITSNIAHELRTPFLGIKALAQGIGQHLPELIRAYDLAIENRFPIEPIRRRQLERLRTSLREIETETDYSNSIIDRLLVNTSERPVEDHEFAYFSAQSCVIEALHRYPFAGEFERDLISVDLDRDFMIHAPNVLVIHVLFNLLKNGIYYVHKAGEGDLTVTLVTGRQKLDSIVVEDTGTGIPPQNLKRIFERFYTTTEAGHGSGIGLSFCKTAMEGLGGAITCDSVFGSYTRFTLTFPRIEHE
jgi:two-component system, CAI-1 autoinducer sensor kinase/phosphatase CqsS